MDMPALESVSSSVRARDYELLLRQIESRSIRCGVVGLGFIGSVLVDALLSAGLTVRGYDRAPPAVARFSRDRDSMPATLWSLCGCDSDPAVLNDCGVIFVAVRNMVERGVVDDEPLHAAARLVRKHSRPCLVILESTVIPGATRRFAEEIGASDDEGLFVAHAPERLSAGQDQTHLRSTPHLVGGLDAMATALAAAMLAKICDRVIPVAAPEVSELSKLLENAFLSVNIALTGEITRLCLGLGIRAQDVCRAAATKPHAFMSFYPGAGLGGHCLPSDLVLLTESARSQGWEPELLSGAIAVTERAPCIVVDRLQQALADRNLVLRGAKVIIVGVGFKTGSSDTARSPAFDVVRTLRSRGACVSYIDHWNHEFLVDGEAVPRVLAEDVDRHRYTAGIILSGDEDLSQESLVNACTVVLDAGGSRLSGARLAEIETL